MKPLTLLAVGGTGHHQILRHHLVFENFSVMVHIMDKQVKRINPLFQPFFQNLPVCVVDDSGNDVKGQDLFSALFTAVDGKGVSQLKQCCLRGPLLVQQLFS